MALMPCLEYEQVLDGGSRREVRRYDAKTAQYYGVQPLKKWGIRSA